MDSISFVKHWFDLAVPKPSDKNRAVQLGVHIEEVGEMADALNMTEDVRVALRTAATALKTRMTIPLDALSYDEKVELLDSLCDQIVTAVGVAHMFGMNIEGALAEVSRSNWSKFVDGKPVFDANGKIAKGPGYSRPNLKHFVPNDLTFVASSARVA